jgi:hypothetical protein
MSFMADLMENLPKLSVKTVWVFPFTVTPANGAWVVLLMTVPLISFCWHQAWMVSNRARNVSNLFIAIVFVDDY